MRGQVGDGLVCGGSTRNMIIVITIIILIIIPTSSIISIASNLTILLLFALFVLFILFKQLSSNENIYIYFWNICNRLEEACQNAQVR